jgi:D-alanyl-D-alanine dipeptidase
VVAVYTSPKVHQSNLPGGNHLTAIHQRSSAILSPLAEARQLVLVTTADWEAVRGRVQYYKRAEANLPWQAAGDEAPVVVGRNGMAWGYGLHAPQRDAGPIKTEGDGKAPAGIFRLGHAFGYTPADQVGVIKFPYLQLTSAIECVDDARSVYYNQIVNRLQITAVDWNSSEQMARRDERYRWGVTIAHNADPPVPKAGSCIFLHIWESALSGTSGCTAMEAARIEELIGWLDPSASPLLAQLPESEFKRLHQSWGLPSR